MSTPQIDDAVQQIVDAFAGVPLENGVSLGEARVIDDYGTDDERAAARRKDELHDWQRISDEFIESHPSVLSFMDEEGLRFHLPAYMRFTLRRYRESESMSADCIIYQLCDPDCTKRLLAHLTNEQIDAIGTFLNACLEIGDDWLDVSLVPLALRQWQGDETAAAELRAAHDAQRAAAEKMCSDFEGLDPELVQKCVSGDLTVAEQQRVLGLIRDATEISSAGQQHRNPTFWSQALLVLICTTPFVAMGLCMYWRLRHDGIWQLVGVGAIVIAFVAFLLHLRREMRKA